MTEEATVPPVKVKWWKQALSAAWEWAKVHPAWILAFVVGYMLGLLTR